MTRGEPLYFGPESRPLFGWLHRAPAPARLGLVICNPFGYEAVCTHRILRHFAQAAAASGVPALRFEYDGTGNSAGDDRDPERLPAWVASVGHAVDALRAHAAVERVVLLGVRLGALIAALAAGKREDVDGLVAIAPVVAGKAHVRELRALQMSTAPLPRPPGVLDEEGVQPALGFPLLAATKADLSAVDLARLERAPAPAVLLLERDDLPADDAWPRHLAALGVAVDRRRLPGYVEMMLGAEAGKVPAEMVGATTEWLGARAALLAAEPPRPPCPGPAPITRSRARLGEIVETPELVDEAGRLFGVLSTPAAPPAARRGLLLLNAGAVHHIGPNRLYVTLARRWAALGHAVLRLDVAGIGDSLPAPGRPENLVYTDEASEDIRQALAFLRRQPGVTEVHALGLCSGGYNAFKAAVAGVPLDGVLLINPLTFSYQADRPLSEAEDKTISEASRYLRRLRDPEAWKKLLRGGLDLGLAARTMRRFVVDRLRGRTQELARRAGLEVGHDLARELTSLADKRVRLGFVFSAGDPGIGLLRTHGGPVVEKLRRDGQLSIEIIEGPDHTFTPLWSHPVLTSTLAAHFDHLPRSRG
ncbi:MAG TPA: alpha/beta hydrolase [Polyangia bacterium]|nr:alpha/beta hydrolase [Polyangia bacterium]